MRIAVGFLMTLPLLAHHSVQAGHDTSKLITLKGTVTLVEFVNPHAHFYLDVVEPGGTVTNWAFEARSPLSLINSGVNKNTFLKQGELISVDAYPAKNGEKFASARTVTWPDGRTMDLHDSFGGQK